MDLRQIRSIVEQQRSRAGADLSVTERQARLRRLRAAVVARRAAIIDALRRDLKRADFESDIAEYQHVLQEIDYAIRWLPRWVRGRRVRSTLFLVGTSSTMRFEPKGSILIMAPWNYPFGLIVNPLVAALAAGNGVVIKPSERAPATEQLIASLVTDTFDPEEVTVITGGVDVASRLLELPFDHFFFTGSTRVGKLVMTAAARQLATVTLELGGKSPAIVDASADLQATAAAIVWGKFFNAGQTCLAPDFVLANDAVHDRVVEAMVETVGRFYGEDEDARRATRDFGRIVDAESFERLVVMVQRSVAQGAVVACGGRYDAGERYVAPTILTGVTADMPVMREEIFGPVLPVLRYDTAEQANVLARTNGTPLGSYVFARDRSTVDRLVRSIPAGGTVVNNTLLHYANSDLPFGGVGASGMGRYHGYYGFLEMSHARPIVRQRGPALSRLLHPPYHGRLHDLVLRLIPWIR
jgi:aldehyde dehydrogenase (NAD+)